MSTAQKRKKADLKATDGYVVAGVTLDDNRFVGRMKAAQLLKIAEDPRRTEDLKQRQGNTELETLFRLRSEVQRLFEGAKKANVEKYANYIVGVHKGQPGMAPPIILYSEALLLDAEEEDGTGFIQIPWDADLIAIDGETQLAARYEAANIDPTTKDLLVPVLICHGKPLDWARQVFHDLNLLAVRPNAAVGIGMDQRDPLTHIARQVEQKVAFFKGRVNKVRRQLRRGDKEIMTITALRGACVTFSEGITGVKWGARSVPVAPSRLSAVEMAAIEWFEALATYLGTAMENRDQTIAAAPAVLAALGALGHSLVEISDRGDRDAETRTLMELLRGVRWEKGKHWEGIAGKFTPKGEFSVGGPKETAYAIYTALKDPMSPGFGNIRVAEPVSLELA